VEVRAADRSAVNADENVIDADLRRWDILEPETGFTPGFNESFHETVAFLRPSVPMMKHEAPAALRD
jgi:hypothetical protein